MTVEDIKEINGYFCAPPKPIDELQKEVIDEKDNLQFTHYQEEDLVTEIDTDGKVVYEEDRFSFFIYDNNTLK
jgi:hypothetical protein